MPNKLVPKCCVICGGHFFARVSTRTCSPKCAGELYHRGQVGRFWEKVQKTESCWLWTGAKNRDGYGNLRFDRKSMLAHRVSWFLEHGELPPQDVEIAHTCDNPPCVNPEHLVESTHLENMLDSVAKNRIGSSGRRSKMSIDNETINKIRELDGLMTQQAIGDLLGVSQTHVGCVLRGKVRTANAKRL